MRPDQKRCSLNKLFEAKLELERREVLRNPGKLALILGYQVEPHHKLMLDYLSRGACEQSEQGYPSRTLILAPRGAGKSTMTTIAYPLWRQLNQPNIRTLIISGTAAQSIMFMRELKMHVEKNEALHLLFGNLIGKKWTDAEVDFSNRKKFTKEANLTAFGIYGTIVARHYDLIIVDDIVSQDSARTQSQREKMAEWFWMSLMPCLEPSGEVIMVGTRYHIHDLYGTLSGAGGAYANDFSIIRAIENGESFWPAKFSIEHLTNLKRQMGTAIFNAQYQNDPSAMSGGQFKPDWFRSRWHWLGDKMLKCSDSDKPIALSQLQLYQGMDLAISQKTESDFTAHVTVGHDQDTGHIYVLEVVRGHFSPQEQENLVVSKYYKWQERGSPPISVGIESIAYQDALPRRIQVTHPDIPVIRIKPYKDKVTRAMTLVAIAEDGRLHIHETEHAALLDELIDFPQGDHDDQVDALELAVQGAKRGSRVMGKPEGL